MPTTKRKPPTPAEQRAQRLVELDWQQQMQLAHAAERAERQAEQAAFLAQVQQNRDARAAALARGEEPPIIPTIDGVYQAKAAEERLEQERLEAERIAALNPRDVWLSTRPLAERQHIAKWEQLNGMAYPVALEALAMH